MGAEEKGSRKERRKEARSARNKKKFDSWVHHRQSKVSKLKSKSEKAGKAIKNNENNDIPVQPERVETSKAKTRDLITSEATELPRTSRKSEVKKELKRKRSSDKISKTNFSKFLDMETDRMMASAEEDMLLERKLAKKLKVKGGRLTKAMDDLDLLLEGIPPMVDDLGKIGKGDKKADAFSSKSKRMDSVNEDSEDEISSGEESEETNSLTSDDDHEDVEEISPKDSDISSDEGGEESDLLISDEEHEDVAEVISADTKIISNTEAGPPKTVSSVDKSFNKEPGKYVAPHLRSRGGDESAEYVEVRKRLRGLLNRLSENNVESITTEISVLFRSVGRAVGTQIISEEVVSSCSGGPRGNEQLRTFVS